jgi:D-alanyl-D-alanine carboxypeptidase
MRRAQASKWIGLASVVLAGFAPTKAAATGPVLLIEADSGRVLYSEDLDHQWHPASLTKIMTAYLAFDAIKKGKLKLDQKIGVSAAAHAQPPSKIGLPVGGQITVELALQALIVKSANDVAVMLAEAIGGTEAEFIVLMNATAKRLGMARTVFVNPHGLPAAEQVTTARDLARLARAVMRDYPDYQPYWTKVDMQIGRRKLGSHNTLLKSYDGADGLKTGFTCDSGYNVVATASRDGKRLVAVVLGEVSGRDRAVRASSLLEHGFQTSAWKLLFNTTTLDSFPPASETKAAISVRNTVASWSCDERARARAIAKSRVQAKKQKALAAKKPGAAPEAPAKAAAVAPPPVAAVAKPKPAPVAAPAPKAVTQ